MRRITPITAAGRAGLGVSMRARSVSGFPRPSSAIMLIPVPPISMHSVVSDRPRLEAGPAGGRWEEAARFPPSGRGPGDLAKVMLENDSFFSNGFRKSHRKQNPQGLSHINALVRRFVWGGITVLSVCS